MEIPQLFEWEVSTNISVEQEERWRIARSDLVPEVVEPTTSAQRGELLKVSEIS